MSIYLWIIIICLAGEVFCMDPRFKRRALRCYPLALVFIGFVIGMRALSVGPDTSTYAYVFQNILHYDLRTLLINKPIDLESGFLVLSWLVGNISHEVTVLFFVVGLFNMGCIGFWIYKKIERPYLGLLLYVCCFLTFFLTGVRQTVALSIVLIASLQLENKKYIRFVILVAIASLFHQTALVGLLYIPLNLLNSRVKQRWVYLMVIIIGFFALLAVRYTAFARIILLVANTRYSDFKVLNSGIPLTYTFMLVMLGFLGVVFSRVYGNEIDYDEQSDYIFMVTAIPIMALVSVNGSIMRIAMYFSMYLISWVPKLFNLMKEKSTRRISYIFAVIVLTCMFIGNVTDSIYSYEFIGWEHLVFGY